MHDESATNTRFRNVTPIRISGLPHRASHTQQGSQSHQNRFANTEFSLSCMSVFFSHARSFSGMLDRTCPPQKRHQAEFFRLGSDKWI